MHLQLVDDASRRVALIVEQLVPDECVLVAGQVVRQRVLIDLLGEVLEDVVEDVEVKPLRGVFLVDRIDMVADRGRYVADLLLVIPNLAEELKIDLRVSRIVDAANEV